MRDSSARSSRPPWLPATLLWGCVIIAAVILGLSARSPELPSEAVVGRMFPRVPSPPPDLRTLLYMLGVGSFVWYAAALALPALVWAARYVDPEGRHRLRAGGIAVLTVVALVGATSMIEYFIVYRGAPVRPALRGYLPMAVRLYLLPWVALVGVVAAIEGRRRANRSTIDRERLRAQVAEQRLISLTGQLQPHFLFNTLQGISTLIHRDPDAADEMLAKLSDLLRDLLRQRDQVLVELGDELRYTRTYLEIAQFRFSDRLTFDIDVPPALQRSAVPLFILQPLVENALTHGIGARARGGRVTVTASPVGDRIHLTVEDDGPGFQNGAPRDGVGLSNTRERLRASFGEDHSLTLQALPQGGVRAVLEMPLRALPRAAEESV